MTMKREVADHQRDRVDCMHCAGSALYTHTMCTHTPHISAFDSAPIPLLSLLLVFVEREREMGTLPPRSVAVDDARVEDAKVGQEEADRDRQQKQLDAGALFVLKSKGSWVHCGYHLTTSIVAPPLLSLPYAFTFLGCMAGILCLVIEALVTFYSYNLISLVFENYAQLGRRHLRLRDMALDILGFSRHIDICHIASHGSLQPTLRVKKCLPLFVAQASGLPHLIRGLRIEAYNPDIQALRIGIFESFRICTQQMAFITLGCRPARAYLGIRGILGSGHVTAACATPGIWVCF
ncbi:uncharacterized protein [Malus domestica]|uniref:uncharacterized protein isoform X5 n=1 Tax=Malus domestica TaxID=3750 RepID=UPI00397474F4